MQIFMSWSGTRSKAIATALRMWLPTWVPGIEFFHSDDIPKGSNWHAQLIDALRQCSLGIFCLTPEALQSPWLLFEAGALAQHGDRPTLLTYLFGIDEMSGPLAHFQHTRFEQADTRRMVSDLGTLVGAGAAAIEQFDEQWPKFSAQVIRTIAVPAPEVIPAFNSVFDQYKTFYEPFPQCSNKRWDDRLRRVVQTHAFLSQREVTSTVQSDVFLHQGVAGLLTALDRYGMHLSSHLLAPQQYDRLPESAQRELEDARLRVVDLVATLQKRWPAPIVPEAPAFETDFATDRRKETIHALEHRLRQGAIPMQTFREQRAEWALDRIAYYVACRDGGLRDVEIEDLISALEIEEANARTRHLVSGLQPLYYAAECLDERLSPTTDSALATRLLEAIENVERFIGAHADRDSGGHIARRLQSMRRKVALTS